MVCVCGQWLTVGGGGGGGGGHVQKVIVCMHSYHILYFIFKGVYPIFFLLLVFYDDITTCIFHFFKGDLINIEK